MSQERCSDIKLLKTTEEKLHFVKELCQPLELNHDALKRIKALFLKELEMGLGKKQNVGASVKCVPTYIQKLPTECQKGKCFVIEISGSGFYILLLTFDGTKEFKEISEKHDFPDHLISADATSLGNYMVDCLCRFVKKLSLQFENLPLAISLTLYARKDDAPMWKKNFNIPTQICDNVVKILQAAVECRGDIKIGNYVLVNETTAVLMSSAWKNNYSKIGVVVDNSCSACYLEQIKHVASLEHSRTLTTIPTMIVNAEWAYFGDNGSLDFIRTPWDHRIGELYETTKTERQFEKMVAGDYIGSLVRYILMNCIECGALLGGNVTTALATANSFPTSCVIDIDSYNGYLKTKGILRTLGYATPENIDCDIVRFICEVVTRRSIYLVAATLAALIDHIGDPYIAVGIEGSICRHRANYREDLQLKLRELVMPEHKVDLIFTEAGRGCGAALVVFEMARFKNMFKSFRSAIANEDKLNLKMKRNTCNKKRKLKKNSIGKANVTNKCKIRK